MASSNVPDRNQVLNQNIKFRVFSQNKGECKREFQINLKNLTWDNFLKNLFGFCNFEEHQLPTIVLLGDKHKIVLRHTNIKQLIRDALEESFKGHCVSLLIPDYESIVYTRPYDAVQRMPNDNEVRRTKAEIDDFINIFSAKYNIPTIEGFVTNAPHVRFFRKENDETARVELPVREDTVQLGELQVERLNDRDVITLLKDGANLIMKTSDNKFAALKFCNDQLPTFNETRCGFSGIDPAYECKYLKVPVLMDDEIKFLFKRDAEFVQMISKTVEATENRVSRLGRYIRMKKSHRDILMEISTTNPASLSTSGATPAATATAPADASVPPPNTSSTAASAAEPAIPPVLESSSNEGAQTPQCTGRAIRRALRSSLQRKNKRCVTAAALANAGVLIPSAENQHDAFPEHANLTYLPRTSNNLTNAFQNLHMSDPVRHYMGHSNSYLWRQRLKPESNATVNANARQETSRENSPVNGETLNKFKTEVLNEVKALVKDALGMSAQTPSTSDMKTSRISHQDQDRHVYKALDGSHFSVGKYKPHDRQHRGGGSSKKKSTSSCPTAPLSSQEKVLEIWNGLFVMSRSGFKVRMPRNASCTIQLVVLKSAGCFVQLQNTNLRLQLGGTNSIECCVTRAKQPFSIRAPAVQVHHDIRIKSKDKSGRFRLYFNITNGSTIIGRSFKIDVRVKKDFIMPFGSIDGTFDCENVVLAVPLEEAAIATSAPDPTVEEQRNSQASKSKEASEAVTELADEGIGGNQEDDFSPTSDSEYSDVQDMLAKDEGIGRCYRTLVDDAPKPITPAAGRQSDGDSDSDTDSSISFLMDENEARDVLNDSLDVIQLPSCFIPNAELTNNVLPVRIKRKNSISSKRTSVEKESSDSQQSVESSAFETKNMTVVASASSDNDVMVQTTTSAATSIPAQSTIEVAKDRALANNTPVVTISDDEEDDDVEFLKESIKSDAVDHAYHRSVYPNLQGLKETPRQSVDANVRPRPFIFAPKQPKIYPPFVHLPPPPGFTTKPSAFEQPAFMPQPPKASSSTTHANVSYTPILPEKLFEMWKNAAVPTSKQVHETVSSVLSSVSNEINIAANAARTAAASAAAAAANIVPNVPMAPSPTAPPAWSATDMDSSSAASEKMHETVSSVLSSVSNEINIAANAARTAAASAAAAAANIVPNVPMEPSPTAWSATDMDSSSAASEKCSGSGAAYPATAAETATAATPDDNSEALSSNSQPPEEKRSKNVSFSSEKPSTQQSSPFEFGQNQDQSDNPTYIHSMYKNLSEQMQSDLITLHDMGFTDDPYIIFLLEQFPNDLNKVIESLINYTTY